MSWAEAMKEMADVASRDRVSTEANVVRSAAPTAWDPYDVWVSRIRQPRDLAASRATATAERQVHRLRG